MDDVWVVIGLLLFGSLLFCLCCYKVSNLLYMLYHIDDDPDSTAPNPGGTGDLTAVGVASVANAAAAAVIASATATSGNSRKGSIKASNHEKSDDSPTHAHPDRIQPGTMPPTAGSKTGFVYVNELGNDNPGKTTQVTSRLIDSTKDYSDQNHIPNSKSNMSLRQQFSSNYDSNRSKSVTSLSVGVQCNPSDVSNVMNQINRSSSGDIKANSRTALIGYGDNDEEEDENDGSINSSILRKHYEYHNCKHHQHNGKSYRRPLRRVHPKYNLHGIGTNKNLHFSDPDFRLSSYNDDEDEEDDEIIPLIQSQYYFNPNKRKVEKESNYTKEVNPRSATEICNRGSFHSKDKKTVIRCPSNHSLVNVRDFNNIDNEREKENSPRHYHPQTRCKKDEDSFETSRSFRGFQKRYSNRGSQKQVQIERAPDPYTLSTKSCGTQSGHSSYRLVIQRRGSTPSPNRLNPAISSTSLLSNDVYEDFHTNSLGRGQNRSVVKDHFNDLSLHRSISPLLKRPRGHSREDIEWPSSPVMDNTNDMLNRPETFYKSQQRNITPSPPNPLRSRISQPIHNQEPSIMSQNLRLSSNSKFSNETTATIVPSRGGIMISPPPMNERDLRKRRSSRRYGSIRVEECSFVEQDGSPSQFPLSASTNYAYESDIHPLKRVYIDKSSMVPRNNKEPFSSINRKCIKPDHDHSLINRVELSQRNCQRHNNEIYMQSNLGGASQNLAPIHYHYSCDVEPTYSSKLHRTSSSDKCSAMYPTSPTEENVHIHQSNSQSHAQRQQQHSSTIAGVRRYRDLEQHQHSSHIYERRNETGTQMYQNPSYSSSSYGNQSRDYPHLRHFHPYSSNQKEKALDTLPTESSFTLNLVQHGAVGNRTHHSHPHHSSSFESIRNQEKNFNPANVSPKRIFRDHRYSPQRTIVPENKSNRSSTGSNIIPPPHDFESDTEQEEILCVESGLKRNSSYNSCVAKGQNNKARDNVSNTSITIKTKEGRHDARPKPPKRIESCNVMQENSFYKNPVSGQWERRQSTQPSKLKNHEHGSALEMVELQLVDKNVKKHLSSPKHISLTTKNNHDDESSVTDSETVFTLTSLSNDVTAIETSTPAKSDSNVDSNSSPKPKYIKEELEDSSKPIDRLVPCDKGLPNNDGSSDEEKEQKIMVSSNNITTPIPNHTTPPINIISSVISSPGKTQTLTNSIQPTNGEKHEQKDGKEINV